MSISFIESPRFPEDISYGSKGGPWVPVERFTPDSGAIIRNRRWAYSYHKADVAYGVTSIAKLEDLLYFWHVVGPEIGFRYKDWSDFKTCRRAETPTKDDVNIGTGTGAPATFQLVKKYVRGAYQRSRKILKPISGTVLVAYGGVLQTEGVGFTINYATGILSGSPGAGVAVTWGGEFDLPMIFALDQFEFTWSDFNSGAASVPLLELPAAALGL
jgi:uncharacterized protein (TIGR02217 family)